jgi:hypothetical protein
MPPVSFVLVILKIGSLKLFVQAGLKPQICQISVSQIARITGVSQSTFKEFLTFCLFVCFDTGSCSVTQAALKLSFFLPQPPKC